MSNPRPEPSPRPSLTTSEHFLPPPSQWVAVFPAEKWMGPLPHLQPDTFCWFLLASLAFWLDCDVNGGLYVDSEVHYQPALSDCNLGLGCGRERRSADERGLTITFRKLATRAFNVPRNVPVVQKDSVCTRPTYLQHLNGVSRSVLTSFPINALRE